MFKKIFIALFVQALFLTFMAVKGNIRAEEPDIELEEIVITATRTKTDILDAPAHVTVITAAEIERNGVKNLAGVLSTAGGVNVRDYGPEGSLKSISIRGSSSEGVLVLIDGMRLNDSRAGGFDLSLIPLHNIEKIEIVRGGTSALYGADAVGGIINIITKKEADGKLTIKFENGSYIPHKAVEVYEGGVEKNTDANMADLFDTQKLTLGYSKRIGKTDLVTSGSLTRANNAYVWNDTEYIDDYRKRINANVLSGDFFASVALPLGEGTISSKNFLSYSSKGTPSSIYVGPYMTLSSDARQTDTLLSSSLHYNTRRFFSDALTLDIKASYKYAALDYENPLKKSNFPQNPFETTPIDDVHKTHSLGIEASQELLSFTAFSLLYGLSLSYDRADSTQIGTPDRLSGGIFAEAPVYLRRTFILTPALRYDYNSDFPDTLNFKLSGMLGLSEFVSFKTSISKSYRVPTLNDLFWPYNPTELVSGNPDLKPETGYSAEAGLSFVKPRFSFDLFFFGRCLFDEINWTMGTDFVFRPENIGETLYPGIELGGRAKLSNRFSIELNYSFIYSFVLEAYDLGLLDTVRYSLSDDRRVPNVPVHKADARILYSDAKNSGSLSLQYESKRYTDTANTSSVEAFVVLNTHYRRKLSEVLSLLVSIDNLLNANYETLEGYVMPPLFIRTGIEAVF